MKIYGIYNIKEEEQCMRVGTLEEIIKFLDLTPRELGLALRKDSTVRNKYKIYFLFVESEETNEQRRTNSIIKRIQTKQG